MQHVGVRIDEIRRQWGLTIEDLAEKSGIPLVRMKFILEEGGCPLVAGEAVAIAIALKSVSPRDLLIYQVNWQLDVIANKSRKAEIAKSDLRKFGKIIANES